MENGGKILGMVLFMINPIYTLYCGYLLGIYPYDLDTGQGSNTSKIPMGIGRKACIAINFVGEVKSQLMVHARKQSNTQMLHGTGIFAYIWLKFMVNVGKYTVRPMEHIGHRKLANPNEHCFSIPLDLRVP